MKNTLNLSDLYAAVLAALRSPTKSLGLTKKRIVDGQEVRALTKQRQYQIERTVHQVLVNDKRFSPWTREIVAMMLEAPHDGIVKKIRNSNVPDSDNAELSVLSIIVGIVVMYEFTDEKLKKAQPFSVRQVALDEPNHFGAPLRPLIGYPVMKDGEAVYGGSYGFLMGLQSIVNFNESQMDEQVDSVYQNDLVVIGPDTIKRIEDAYADENTKRIKKGWKNLVKFRAPVADGTGTNRQSVEKQIEAWVRFANDSDTPWSARGIILNSIKAYTEGGVESVTYNVDRKGRNDGNTLTVPQIQGYIPYPREEEYDPYSEIRNMFAEMRKVKNAEKAVDKAFRTAAD